MLVWLIEATGGLLSEAYVKTTLRAALAALASFVLAIFLGGRFIAWLAKRFREPIVSDSAELRRLHQAKQRTPTMGGLFIVAGIVLAGLAFGDLTNPYLLVSLLLVVALATLGAVDDLAKLRSGRRGLTARTKLLWQIGIATIVALLVFRLHGQTSGALDWRIPMWGTSGALGWWFVPLAVLVLVGSSNAANLTDGLDGLAGGCLICATMGMATMAYVAGHAKLAAYLGVPFIPHASETLVLAGAVLGGLFGFLWFNCHPAQVFMGDTGSLPLGGLLGMLAIVARQELLLVVVGGVFVVEAASVIIQVGSCKWRGRRVFLCAPLHHHFQFRGWPENRIVVRFWIASALCAILGVASTKFTLADRSETPTESARLASPGVSSRTLNGNP